MKTSLIILFTLLIRIGFSQTNPDSLHLQKSDSTGLFMAPDSLSVLIYLPEIPHHTSYTDPVYLSIYIPNCSELVKRNGLFYLGQDSLSYCGYCTVLQSGKINSITFYEYAHSPFSLLDNTSTSVSQWSGGYFTNENGEKVKIISGYKNGKRDGRREYFNTQGELYKIEIFKNGIPQSTCNIK